MNVGIHCPSQGTPLDPSFTNRPNLTCTAAGSIIQIDNKALIESVELTGVDFKLYYSSDRVAGATKWNNLDLQVSSSSYVPNANITQETVKVQIAGQELTHTDTTPVANENTLFQWNGLDSNNNPVSGSTPVTMERSTSYNEQAIQALHPGVDIIYLNSSPKPQNFAVGSIFTSGATSFKTIGGWDFEIHHHYDPVRKQLYLGTGDTLNLNFTEKSGGVKWVVARENGEVYVFDSNWKHVATRSYLTGATLFEFSYNANGFLVLVTDAFGNETSVEYSGQTPTSITGPDGHVTSLTVNAQNFLATIVSPGGRTHSMTYSATGLMLSFSRPSSFESTFTYDQFGNLLTDSNDFSSSVELDEVQAPSINGGKKTLLKSTAVGRVTEYFIEPGSSFSYARSVKTPDGTVTKHTQYSNGASSFETVGINRSESTTTAGDQRFGSVSSRPWTLTINNGGLNQAIFFSESYSLSNNDDPFSLTNLTLTTTVNSKSSSSVYSSAANSIVATSAVGRSQTQILNANDQVISTQLASYTPVTTSYDARGRVSQIAQGANRLTDFNYHATTGFLSSIVNALNQTTSFTYDVDGRVLTQTLPDGRVIGMSYDANGNLATLTPPGRTSHVLNFNGLDLMSSYQAPGASSIQYFYNYDRDLIQITRPSGQSVYFNHSSSTDLLPSITLPTGNRTFSYSYRRLATANSEDYVNRTYGYSGELITSESAGLSGVFASLTYQYNNFFNITSDTLNSGLANITLTRTYDDDQLLVGIGDQTITRSNTSGFVTQTTLDQITQDYSYNSFGELSQLYAKYAGTDDLYKEVLTRDNLGRVATKTETYGTASADVYAYTYDAAGRLTTVTKNGNAHESYAYDSNSNRISQTVAGISVSPAADLSGFNIGNVNTCAITSQGLKCWGYGGNGQNGLSSTLSIGDNEALTVVGHVSLNGTAKSVSLGEGHTCALLTNGTVRCWGLSTNGQLGLANTTTIGDNEVPSSVSTVSIGGVVTKIAVGGFHSCALKENNQVVCWGAGSYGRLGYGNTNTIGDNETPSSIGEVDLGITDEITQIEAGIAHTCALTEQQEMKCWGRNEYWQLGTGAVNANIGDNETPAAIGMLDLGQPVTRVAVGGYHTCALLLNKKVKCWGRNDQGQLGLATTTTSTQALASQPYVDVGEDVKWISASKNSTCVITVTDKAKCWGANQVGQLGLANTTQIGDNEHPSTISQIALNGIPVAIDSSGNHTCAVLNNGNMQCWGTGLYGVLGYGNANDIGDNETPASIGTIPSINTGSIEVDGQDRLLRFGSKMLAWDANGDLKTLYDSGTQTTQTFTYDLLGNLKQAVLPNKTINYGVDAHDRRFVKKVGSTVIEHYIWNFENQLKAITDQSGVITKAFVYGTKAHVPDYMITSTGDFQIVTDHLGSPVVVVNAATGEVVEEIRYDSFGKVVADTNPGFIPFGYAGCLYDQDTKLCRFGARDYDAAVGRWTSKDPILFKGGDTNLYGYVLQDPINLIDPDGKSPMLLLGPVLAFEVGYDIGTFVTTLIQTGSFSKAGKEVYNQSPLRNTYNTGVGALFPEQIGGPIQVLSNPDTMNVILQRQQRTKKIDNQAGVCE